MPDTSRPFALAGDEVHVWVAGLQHPIESLNLFAASLSEEEASRARRFVFERDRDRYVAARGQLRRLLGDYLGLGPGEIVLAYGPHGKPELAAPHAGSRLQFNLSHSRDLVLYAFCPGRRVGIDVEWVRPMPDQEDFARQFFSPRERELLSMRSGSDRTAAFFVIWTCKESLLKATGSGLTKPIDRTEVALERDGAVRLVMLDGSEAESAAWQLVTFEPAPGFRGSLAVEGSGARIVFRRSPSLLS
jgi:4'-phosphopantetheinyl transferase